jgi:hypothetical protein
MWIAKGTLLGLWLLGGTFSFIADESDSFGESRYIGISAS